MALAAAVLVGTTVAYRAWLGVSSPVIAALSYLLVVLVAAAVSRLWVAVAASGLAIVLLNYAFFPPVGTLTIAEPQNWVALGVLLAVSLIGSQLSASARVQAREALARRDEVGRLFEVTRDVLLTVEGEAYRQLAQSVATRFSLDYAAICLPASGGWSLHEAGDLGVNLHDEELEHALRAAQDAVTIDRERTSSGRIQTVAAGPDAAICVSPLRVGDRTIGLMATSRGPIEPEALEALSGVVAIAVERVKLLEERKAADLARQSDELKSALLASLAHDLRTPLTAIRVAAANLQAGWASDDERRTQGEIVQVEVERLNRLFQDILDMARIDTRAMSSSREWVTCDAIVEAALAHVQHALSAHTVSVAAGEEVVEVDPRLTSAALAHLLENAAHYSSPGTTISVEASAGGDGLHINVDDEGPGVAEADMPHLFERFYRGRDAARHSIGVGLGLALTRGLLDVQGGRVWAENRASGGARFSIVVPGAVRPAATSPEALQ